MSLAAAQQSSWLHFADVDSASSRVGIGASTPLYTLHVACTLVSGVSTSASGLDAAVGGGNNEANFNFSAVLGGRFNVVDSTYSSIGARVLVLGGATCTQTSCRVSTVLEYDVAAPQGWMYRASLLESRTGAVAAIVGGALQLAGGSGGNSQRSSTSEVYDPQTVELHDHRRD